MPAPMQAGLPTPTAPESGEPPMGNSPATQPTPNAGNEVQAIQQASLLLDAASELLPKIGASSAAGKLLVDFIKGLQKIIPPGSVSPAAKQNQMDAMQRANVQNGRNVAMLRQQQAQPQSSSAGAQAPAQQATA